MASSSETADGAGATRTFRRRTPMVLLVAAVLVVSTVGGASAAALITGRQIKNGTVTGRDLRDHSLRAQDARAGVVRPGPAGPQGATGPTGLQSGATGAPGSNGLGGYATVVSPDAVTVPATTSVTSTIACPPGSSALGGGVFGADVPSTKSMVVTRSMPALTGTRITNWTVTVKNPFATDIGVYVWAVCASV
jgi:hypothetical protein